MTYVQFPTPDILELKETASEQAVYQPPQTTHYWTSDSTRRIEYEAIDAASRGLKGWIRRHLVPECFAHQHVAFDDDTGSVRRYRIDLEDDNCDLKATSRRNGKSVWSLRKSGTA